MSLRRTTPLAFHPRGISDARDSSQVFSGAMAMLKDLIPDPSTKGLWQCRPAAFELVNMSGGGGFSSGFSDGFTVETGLMLFPEPLGVVSCLLVVGNVAYGMVGAGGTQDYPFAFDLSTNTLIAVSGIVTGVGNNLPTSQPTSGDWTPPTMDVVGSTVLVTHPGFVGTGNWLGTFDISTPTAPVWSAGNLTFTSGSSSGPFFSPSSGVPVAVKAFNGRAYWAYNPASGPSATVFSDVLTPTVATNAGTVQIINYDDNVPITALGALPLSNQLGGIIQGLLVFKGVTNIYQITGDVSLGPGPPQGTLTKNSLNVATGTFAPNSLATTSKGLAFAAPDGIRIIDFNATVSDPIGLEGMGKTTPFLSALVPTRIAAAANGTVYRVSVQDASLNNSPLVEYWLDFARGGIWSGPHSLPARVIKPYKNTFITAPYAMEHTLQQSDYLQSQSSIFVENGLPMTFGWLTSLLPDTDQMSENAMIETTIYLAQGSQASYVIQALNEGNVALGSFTVTSATGGAFWGTATSTPPGFIWGQATWGGTSPVLFPQAVYWPKPIVFRRLAISVTGPSSQLLRLGTLHLRYEQLGYLQQPLINLTPFPQPPPPPPPPPTLFAYVIEDGTGVYITEDGSSTYVEEAA